MSSVCQKVLGASLSLLLVFTLVLAPKEAYAISRGFEIASIGTGGVMVSVGKAKRNKTLRYVGWGLITIGGSVTAVDGLGAVITAAFTGAMLGAMIGSFFNFLNPATYLQPRYQHPDRDNKISQTYNQLDPENKVMLADAMREVRTEVSLAANTSANTDDMVIQSISSALGVQTKGFATDFNSYMHAVSVSAQVDPTPFIHCTTDPETSGVIKAIFLNYQTVHSLSI